MDFESFRQRDDAPETEDFLWDLEVDREHYPPVAEDESWDFSVRPDASSPQAEEIVAEARRVLHSEAWALGLEEVRRGQGVDVIVSAHRAVRLGTARISVTVSPRTFASGCLRGAWLTVTPCDGPPETIATPLDGLGQGALILAASSTYRIELLRPSAGPPWAGTLVRFPSTPLPARRDGADSAAVVRYGIAGGASAEVFWEHGRVQVKLGASTRIDGCLAALRWQLNEKDGHPGEQHLLVAPVSRRGTQGCEATLELEPFTSRDTTPTLQIELSQTLLPASAAGGIPAEVLRASFDQAAAPTRTAWLPILEKYCPAVAATLHLDAVQRGAQRTDEAPATDRREVGSVPVGRADGLPERQELDSVVRPRRADVERASHRKQRAPRRHVRARRLRTSILIIAALTVTQLAIQLRASAGTLERRIDPPTLCSREFGDKLVVAAAWQGFEAENFERVLDVFRKKTGIDIVYATGTRDIATKLRTSIEEGCPPHVALLPQPGLLKDLTGRNALVPLEQVVGKEVDRNYARLWRELGSVDDTLYGVWFKAANKSIIWYNTELFKQAGVTPPRTWEELKEVARVLAAKGITPFSVAGATGWTLTDWFENVYLRTAGPQMYDRLAAHEIPWTDRSVRTALSTLAEIFKNDAWLVEGREGALGTTFEDSVVDVFSAQPKAAMVFEADFVATVISERTPSQVGVEANFFEFPSIGGSDGVVWSLTTAGGDMAVLLRNDEPGRKLIRFLATPQAAEPWARVGGFISPNNRVNLDVYENEAVRRVVTALRDVESPRFDLSDLQPPAFGSASSSGMRAILQDLLRTPDDVDGIAARLEAARATA